MKNSVSAVIENYQINLKFLPSKSLLNGWSLIFDKASFVRCGLIDSKSKAEFFYRCIKNTKGRIISCQLAVPEREWDQITAQHTFLAWICFEHKSHTQIGHLVLPTEHIYMPQPEEKQSDFFHRAVDRLLHVQNIDALDWYCYWMAEEIESISKKFSLESLDIYTLEAFFKDFLIESRAKKLRSLEVQTVEAVLKLGALHQLIQFPLKPEDEVIRIEEVLIRARYESKERLIVQLQFLDRIANTIEIIEESHPELTRLENMAKLLSKLLRSQLENLKIGWGEQLMVMQLLHEEMGITTVLSCATGLERTSMAFAIQLATAILKVIYGVKETVNFALKLSEHLKEKRKNSTMIARFRYLIVKILDQICIPLGMEKREGIIENLEYLDFLPVHGTIHDEKGELVHVKLLELNPETGVPAGLTEAGHSFLKKISPQRRRELPRFTTERAEDTEKGQRRKQDVTGYRQDKHRIGTR